MQTGYFTLRQMEHLPLGAETTEPSLFAGDWQLLFSKGGIQLNKCGKPLYTQEQPCLLEVKDFAAFARRTAAPYTHICMEGEQTAVAYGEVSSADGSVFEFRDLWRVQADNFCLSRQVVCTAKGGRDQGFATLLSLNLNQPDMECLDFFAPGVWYKKNKNVVNGAIAGNYNHTHFYIKETRLALPFLMAQNEEGDALSLGDACPRPDTRIYERLQDWAVHDSISYAAIGVKKQKNNVSMDYIFPGSEGEVNYTNRHYVWCRRSHPINVGEGHCYNVEVHPFFQPEFKKAMQHAWSHFFYQKPPAIKRCENDAVFSAGIELLDVLCQEYCGVVGLPFKARIPSGEIEHTWMQMGFVGQQIPAAYQLLRLGFLTDNQSYQEKGKAMLDFWATKSCTESGIPYHTYAVDPPVFTDAPDRYLPDSKEVLWLRTVTDGLEAMVQACEIGKANKIDTRIWEKYCTDFGNFLIKKQRGDGSWARAYTPDGEEHHTGSFNTTNALRFLCRLYRLTGEEKLLEAARKGGEFCLQAINKESMYVGGTTDNDNTIDKEGGMIALFGFLELYETTADIRYLEAAKDAALFSATWVYCWSYPVYPQEAYFPFAQGADITGTSLIATGHSGADVYMCYGAYAYTRLWELTGDTMIRDMAQILLHNTRQTTDWSGKYGFKYRGLSEEGGENAAQSYRGVEMWLPWQTIAQIEPLSQLMDRYGTMEPDKILMGDSGKQ